MMRIASMSITSSSSSSRMKMKMKQKQSSHNPLLYNPLGLGLSLVLPFALLLLVVGPGPPSGVHIQAFSLFTPTFIQHHQQQQYQQQQQYRNCLSMAIENFEDIDEDDDAWDSPEDYNNDDSTSTSSSKQQQQQQQQPSLGINIGTQLEPLTPKEAQQLKQEATQTINNAFQERLDEIEDLKKQVQSDFETSKETLRFASDLRAKVETEKLMSKIDNLSNDFLKENEELRMGTKLAASADRRMDGVGLEVGSWGKLNGMDVVLSSGLLGSVGSAVPSPSSDTDTGTGTSSSEEENGNMENRILIICDEKQDTNIQKVFDKFTTLITNQFNTPVQIETYKPTSNLPIGGNNAQCLIISSTSLSNGQSSANNILSRVLRRTVSPGGGAVSKPPSHIVIVSPLGTERIEKFPYSMQNMMGGNKLKKAREVEEVAISTVKGRLVTDSSSSSSSSSKQATLDYTIVKLGEIVNDDKVGSNGDNTLNIMAGDCGDGKVGIDASANVLLQAVTLRPYARNATLSVVGSCCADGNYESISEEQWEDYFLRLYGPELWRSTSLYTLDDGGDNNSDDEMVERKFEELANYIGEWSKTFDNGAKGTGLTTPVRVEKSRFLKDQETSIMRRKFGVRLEFKPTATGSAYKSKGEEREMEQSSSSSSQSQQPVFSNFNQNREGGVEIRVEQIRMKDGKQELRVRARRCNMGDFTVVKELSEETIVKNLERAVGVWMKK